MRREERLQKILELLDEEGFLTVEDLSRRFFISLPTAYRDLRRLEQQRLIIRGDGGAMPVAAEKATLPLDFRKVINAQAKAVIAKKAVALIRPGSVIFLDASTTAANMIGYLHPDMDLTVLTNGLMTAVQLSSAGIRTYCVGGNLIDNSIAVGGKLAGEVVDRFRIDMMFFSSYGVDAKGVIIDTADAESTLRRRILQKPVESVFLCDQSKFGKSSVFRIASIAMVDYVIANAPLPESYPLPKEQVIVV